MSMHCASVALWYKLVAIQPPLPLNCLRMCYPFRCTEKKHARYVVLYFLVVDAFIHAQSVLLLLVTFGMVVDVNLMYGCRCMHACVCMHARMHLCLYIFRIQGILSCICVDPLLYAFINVCVFM